jgi:hypothetical protein
MCFTIDDLIQELFAEIILSDTNLVSATIAAIHTNLNNSRVATTRGELTNEGFVIQLFYSFHDKDSK